MSRRCSECGLPEGEHHDFVAEMPPGCECDPQEWPSSIEVPEVCGAFVDGPEEGRCGACEHDEACHEGLAEKEPKP